jgi:hypothetical protein
MSQVQLPQTAAVLPLQVPLHAAKALQRQNTFARSTLMRDTNDTVRRLARSNGTYLNLIRPLKTNGLIWPNKAQQGRICHLRFFRHNYSVWEIRRL